jgi:hypothetical protein
MEDCLKKIKGLNLEDLFPETVPRPLTPKEN